MPPRPPPPGRRAPPEPDRPLVVPDGDRETPSSSPALPSSTPHHRPLFRSIQPAPKPRELPRGIPQNAAQAILARFLKLDDPQISTKLVEYLQLDGITEMYINFIVLSPRPLCQPHQTPATRGYRLAALLDMFPLPHRTWTDPEAMKQSYSAAQALSTSTNINSNSIALQKLDVILCTLFEIFDPEARGNFYHFRKLTKYFLDTYAERTLQCLLTVNTNPTNNTNHVVASPIYPPGEEDGSSPTTDPVYLGQVEATHSPAVDMFIKRFRSMPHQMPLLFGALPYLYSPPILDFVTHVVVRRSTPNVYRERFDHLRDEGFTDFLFMMLDGRWHPLIYQGAADFLTTLIDGHYNLPRLDLLFYGWELNQFTPISYTTILISNINQRPPGDALASCCIDILATLMRKTTCCYGRWVRQRQNVRHIEPQFGPQNSLIPLGLFVRRELTDHVPQLCQLIVARGGFTPSEKAREASHPDAAAAPGDNGPSPVPFDYKHLQIIEIIYQVLVETDHLDSVLRSIDLRFWTRLVDLYFIHTSNSQLQSLLYKLVALLVHSSQNLTGYVSESMTPPTADRNSDSDIEPGLARSLDRRGSYGPLRSSHPADLMEGVTASAPASTTNTPHRHKKRPSISSLSGGTGIGPAPLPTSLNRILSMAAAASASPLSGQVPPPLASSPTSGSSYHHHSHSQPGSLGSGLLSPPPHLAAAATSATAITPPSAIPIIFGHDNEILLHLIHTCHFIERLIAVCQNNLPSNSLRGTSLLILNTFRLSMDTAEVDIHHQYQLHLQRLHGGGGSSGGGFHYFSSAPSSEPASASSLDSSTLRFQHYSVHHPPPRPLSLPMDDSTGHRWSEALAGLQQSTPVAPDQSTAHPLITDVVTPSPTAPTGTGDGPNINGGGTPSESTGESEVAPPVESSRRTAPPETTEGGDKPLSHRNSLPTPAGSPPSAETHGEPVVSPDFGSTKANEASAIHSEGNTNNPSPIEPTDKTGAIGESQPTPIPADPPHSPSLTDSLKDLSLHPQTPVATLTPRPLAQPESNPTTETTSSARPITISRARAVSPHLHPLDHHHYYYYSAGSMEKEGGGDSSVPESPYPPSSLLTDHGGSLPRAQAGFWPHYAFSRHWTQTAREIPGWRNFLPELLRKTYVQIEPWTSFELVNFERKAFACQPPLPYFSPLTIRMPEEYANNYLNRRTLPNTQEGMLGTRGTQNPQEPIRGIQLDEKSIDVGSLFAYCLGFGISVDSGGGGDEGEGEDDEAQKGESGSKPNSRTIRKRGPGSRRKRVKSVGIIKPAKLSGASLASSPTTSNSAAMPTSKSLPASPMTAVGPEHHRMDPDDVPPMDEVVPETSEGGDMDCSSGDPADLVSPIPLPSFPSSIEEEGEGEGEGAKPVAIDKKVYGKKAARKASERRYTSGGGAHPLDSPTTPHSRGLKDDGNDGDDNDNDHTGENGRPSHFLALTGPHSQSQSQSQSQSSHPSAKQRRPSNDYESDTLNEIQREQQIKMEFFKRAGIPDQSTVPLYPPVLVRPRSVPKPETLAEDINPLKADAANRRAAKSSGRPSSNPSSSSSSSLSSSSSVSLPPIQSAGVNGEEGTSGGSDRANHSSASLMHQVLHGMGGGHKRAGRHSRMKSAPALPPSSVGIQVRGVPATGLFSPTDGQFEMEFSGPGGDDEPLLTSPDTHPRLTASSSSSLLSVTAATTTAASSLASTSNNGLPTLSSVHPPQSSSLAAAAAAVTSILPHSMSTPPYLLATVINGGRGGGDLPDCSNVTTGPAIPHYPAKLTTHTTTTTLENNDGGSSRRNLTEPEPELMDDEYVMVAAHHQDPSPPVDNNNADHVRTDRSSSNPPEKRTKPHSRNSRRRHTQTSSSVSLASSSTGPSYQRSTESDSRDMPLNGITTSDSCSNTGVPAETANGHHHSNGRGRSYRDGGGGSSGGNGSNSGGGVSPAPAVLTLSSLVRPRPTPLPHLATDYLESVDGDPFEELSFPSPE
ncbi:hypothetical protein H4R33_004480 [Dimargaris cristalligena]|nr:hypothetical protein H4R33_004480 [Dimargaris cristalligena]